MFTFSNATNQVYSAFFAKHVLDRGVYCVGAYALIKLQIYKMAGSHHLEEF